VEAEKGKLELRGPEKYYEGRNKSRRMLKDRKAGRKKRNILTSRPLDKTSLTIYD